MKILSAASSLVLVTAAVAMWAGCATATEDESEGATQGVTSRPPGAGDPNAPMACQVVAEKDGHTMTAEELRRLDDPVANFLLKGQGCPTTFTQIQQKLQQVDPCGDNDEGLSTRFVTDRAQILGVADTYRAVVKRACQQRANGEILMSVFGIGTQLDAEKKVSAVRVPDNSVELIGEQKITEDGVTTGVFNYYAREEGKWKFFGSSADYIAEGYTCNADGACLPKAAAKQRCAGCHVGGGLVMKELRSPWVNWEPDFETPGITEILEKHADKFGTRGDGVDLEGTVAGTNQTDWIPARIKAAKAQGLKEVLRPLFCTMDVNIDSGFIPSNFFTDGLFRTFSSIDVSGEDYQAAIAKRGQKIIDGRTRQQIRNAAGQPVLDTVAGFSVPVRSAQDDNYVFALIQARIVDIDFVKDVLSIDMGRPTFSPTRCGLLDLAPNVPAAQMTSANVKKAFVGALASATSPAAKELLASLKNEADAGSHDLAAKKFMEACDKRFEADKAGMLDDVLTYASHLRLAARRTNIMEFAETLPFDDRPESKAAFDPVTCKLQ